MKNIKRKRYVLSKTAKYLHPCLVTLSGFPGSGKTVCAKVLSKNLKIFIVSNDFIRGYVDENISENEERKLNKKVLLTNIVRLINLLTKRVSVVLDSDVNDIEKLKKIQLLTKLFKYQLINIKVETNNDFINIERIEKRKNEDTTFLDVGIIGDNIKSFCYSEKFYKKIKGRKNHNIDDDIFDYILNNDDSLEIYIKNINDISDDILANRLVLK